MIIGEAEVQGQVKRAYELALVEGATGPILNRLFRDALAAGKRARTETGISERSLSIPSVAVELAQRTLGELEDRRVLVVGAGETAELTARALAAKGVEAIFIANRHYDRAIGLAERFGGHAVRFEELPEELADADIVVASTSSPHHVIEREALAEVMAVRDGRPLLLIDLAVPRDIQPACREVAGASLYDMDDLQSLVERNLSGREAEARRVEGILRSELARFERWLAAQDVTPTITALHDARRRGRRRVLDENESRWEGLTEADRERLAVAARAIASRLLHEPTLRLKRDGRGRRLLREGRGAARALRARPRQRAARGAPGPRSRTWASAGAAAAGEPAAAGLARQRAGADPGRGRSPRRSAAPRWSTVRTADGDVGDKARFVSGIERAILAGEVAIGVHSAKDLPGELPDGLALVGVPGREDPSDALIGGASGARRPRRGRAGRDLEPAPALAAARAAPGPRGRRAARQRRHPPGAARGGRLRRDRARDRRPRAARPRRTRSRSGSRSTSSPRRPGQGCLALEAAVGDEAAAAAAAAISDRAALARAHRRARRGAGARGDAATRRSASARASSDERLVVLGYAGLARRRRRGCATGSRAIPSSRPRSARRSPSGCSPRAPARSSPPRSDPHERPRRESSTWSAPGPGDPGLMTVRSLELIASADVILHDRLIGRRRARRRPRRRRARLRRQAPGRQRRCRRRRSRR